MSVLYRGRRPKRVLFYCTCTGKVLNTYCTAQVFPSFRASGRGLYQRGGAIRCSRASAGACGGVPQNLPESSSSLVFTAAPTHHDFVDAKRPHVHSRVRWAHRAVAAGVVTNPEPITSQSCGRSTKPRSRPSRRRRRRPMCSHGSTRSRPPSCARHHRAYRLELPRSSACQHTRLKRRRPWPRRRRLKRRRMGTPTARLSAGNISTLEAWCGRDP